MANKATHRRKMEQALGRPLLGDEFVHHINGKQNDNRFENLLVVTPSEHRRLHPRKGETAKALDTRVAMRPPKTIEKRVVGTYFCWDCHQAFPLYYGQRRRYCDSCAHERERAGGGFRKPTMEP